jgi:hypothetical protein
VFGSAYAAALYLSQVLHFPPDQKVYVCGMKGIQEELEAQGIAWEGGEVLILAEVWMEIHACGRHLSLGLMTSLK